MYDVFDPPLPDFGSVVGMKIDPLGLTHHVGILVPHLVWGAAVISFAQQGKIVQPVREFACGADFDLVDYPSATPQEVVVWRAENAVPLRRYHPMGFNCDYLVRYCHGMSLESPQAQRMTVLAVGVAAAAIAVVARA